MMKFCLKKIIPLVKIKIFYVVRETFPSTIINQFFKIKLANENNSASVFYLDDYRKKVNIGLVLENQSEIEKPLLSPAYYIKKSLDQNNNIYISSLKNIKAKGFNYIFTLLPKTIARR